MASKKKPAKEPLSAGDRLKASVLEEYAELSEAELQLLGKAASVADLLERVEAELVTAPLVESGSRRQPIPSPLIRTAVELQQHFLMLLRALGLPLGDDGEEPLVSQQARKAAMSRWHGRS